MDIFRRGGEGGGRLNICSKINVKAAYFCKRMCQHIHQTGIYLPFWRIAPQSLIECYMAYNTEIASVFRYCGEKSLTFI